jgi:hypothetical protein
MKERSILFSGPMVRAILAGTKTQTRRGVKRLDVRAGMPQPENDSLLSLCSPYGQPGDRLWVRETWAWFGCERLPCEVLYRADGHTKLYDGYGRWRPSIHMPRWASRILLEITDVRVERLCDISEADARAEGIKVDECGHAIREEDHVAWGGARSAFADLWASINGPDSWAANPWVWVISFRRGEP